MTWIGIRLGFSVAIAAGVAWFIRTLNGPMWADGLATLLTGVAFYGLLTSVANEWERADRILAEAKAESQKLRSALGPEADDTPVMLKKDERVDPFADVLDLIDQTAEVPAPKTELLFASYRYRGTRRQSKSNAERSPR